MCITHSPKIFRKSFDRITRFAKKSFQIFFFFFLITTNESSRRWFPMERQFYESHISPLPSSLFSSFPYLDDSSFFAYHFFFFNSRFPPPCSPCFKKSNPLSVVPFGPHYQHWLFSCFRNAQERLCFFYYDSLLLFFLNIFLSPSPSSFSLFSLSLSSSPGFRSIFLSFSIMPSDRSPALSPPPPSYSSSSSFHLCVLYNRH